MKACGQLKESKYQNYGCQLENPSKNYFECTNRNDKSDILFKNPPVPEEKGSQAVNYNEVLNFNNNSFMCGQQEISWADFETKQSNGSEKCQLKNGKNVTLSKLWRDLKTDYSFKMSPKLTEL